MVKAKVMLKWHNVMRSLLQLQYCIAFEKSHKEKVKEMLE